MLSLLTKSFTILALGLVAPAYADDPDANRTMNVALNWNGDQNHAVIWISDGTRFSDLSVVAKTIEEFGVTDISLSVLARGGEPNPMHVSNDQHIGIQLNADRVDLFLADSVPFEFTKTLSENLQQLKGVTVVALRSGRNPMQNNCLPVRWMTRLVVPQQLP